MGFHVNELFVLEAKCSSEITFETTNKYLTYRRVLEGQLVFGKFKEEIYDKEGRVTHFRLLFVYDSCEVLVPLKDFKFVSNPTVHLEVAKKLQEISGPIIQNIIAQLYGDAV